jgi:hypothetical protein
MGSTHRVVCDCGFRSSVRVGGPRATYLEESYFPFYCKTCGIVSVNYRAKDIRCPKCQSRVVRQYGKPPISTHEEKVTIIQDFNYSAPYKGNLCPGCKKMTLQFLPASIRFD